MPVKLICKLNLDIPNPRTSVFPPRGDNVCFTHCETYSVVITAIGTCHIHRRLVDHPALSGYSVSNAASVESPKELAKQTRKNLHGGHFTDGGYTAESVAVNTQLFIMLGLTVGGGVRTISTNPHSHPSLDAQLNRLPPSRAPCLPKARFCYTYTFHTF